MAWRGALSNAASVVRQTPCSRRGVRGQRSDVKRLPPPSASAHHRPGSTWRPYVCPPPRPARGRALIGTACAAPRPQASSARWGHFGARRWVASPPQQVVTSMPEPGAGRQAPSPHRPQARAGCGRRVRRGRHPRLGPRPPGEGHQPPGQVPQPPLRGAGHRARPALARRRRGVCDGEFHLSDDAGGSLSPSHRGRRPQRRSIGAPCRPWGSARRGCLA